MITEAQSDHVHSKAIPDLITKLLAERQEMLVLFNHLMEMKPYPVVAPVQPLLQRFCQVLVDYAALGHFEVFACIEDNAKVAQCYRRVKCLAKQLYPRIIETTQMALDFNDHYDSDDRYRTWDTLGADLSRLGEHLATRIDLEDRLISAFKLPVQASVQ